LSHFRELQLTDTELQLLVAIVLQQPEPTLWSQRRGATPRKKKRTQQMMDMMINTAKKNLEVLADMQKRNEDMVKVMLDHTAKTREQLVTTNESLLNLATEQGKAATKYMELSMKAGREMMEKQVAETQKVMATKK
jgi:hypothetical protein